MSEYEICDVSITHDVEDGVLKSVTCRMDEISSDYGYFESKMLTLNIRDGLIPSVPFIINLINNETELSVDRFESYIESRMHEISILNNVLKERNISYMDGDIEVYSIKQGQDDSVNVHFMLKSFNIMYNTKTKKFTYVDFILYSIKPSFVNVKQLKRDVNDAVKSFTSKVVIK